MPCIAVIDKTFANVLSDRCITTCEIAKQFQISDLLKQLFISTYGLEKHLQMDAKTAVCGPEDLPGKSM